MQIPFLCSGMISCFLQSSEMDSSFQILSVNVFKHRTDASPSSLRISAEILSRPVALPFFSCAIASLSLSSDSTVYTPVSSRTREVDRSRALYWSCPVVNKMVLEALSEVEVLSVSNASLPTQHLHSTIHSLLFSSNLNLHLQMLVFLHQRPISHSVLCSISV